MNIIEIINKKKNGLSLSKDEINYAVSGYVQNEVADYQMSSLLMAICINQMNNQEVIDLTKAMIDSGEQIDLSFIEGVCADKHSTGGVGDKTTLIVGPLVASCLVNVVKMSGRGLGHTGGTIDKLESIPGFKVEVKPSDLIKQIKDINIAIISQTGNLVPADKKIYALRDVTGTVDNIALIASSIMCKKIASGASNIVLDVKVGNGALMNNTKDAVKLARMMVKIGKTFSRNVMAVLTNMDQPLGNNIGNSLEISEAIDILKNKKNSNLSTLCIFLASNMVSLALKISYKKAQKLVMTKWHNGEAYKKFLQLIEYQGGNIAHLGKAQHVLKIKAPKSGYITHIDTYKLGLLLVDLGGGRITKDDIIDYEVGFILAKGLNDYINDGDVLLKVHYNDKNVSKKDILDCFIISPRQIKMPKLIFKIIK